MAFYMRCSVCPYTQRCNGYKYNKPKFACSWYRYFERMDKEQCLALKNTEER